MVENGDARVEGVVLKTACERCGEPLDGIAALHCSFNCTFCAVCAEQMEQRCPNCNGVLRAR